MVHVKYRLPAVNVEGPSERRTEIVQPLKIDLMDNLPKLPLVAMMDFLDECSLEQEILEGVARVVPFSLDKSKPLPPEVPPTI